MVIHTRRCMMRTNVVIDDALLEEAMRLTGAKTKKEVITKALEELVATRKRLNLLDLAGRIRFREDYDYKRLREGK
jgi:Arc/MetJ family transcription regulator